MRFTWQHLTIIVIALAIVGTIGWFVMGEGGNDGPKKLWFYDLNTGELFPGDIAELAPIAAPSGDFKGGPAGTPAGVLASVVRIDGSEERKVLFLQAYSKEAKELILASRSSQSESPPSYEKIMAGTLVALPPAKPGDPIKWVPTNSPEGYKISSSSESLSGGKPYVADLP